MASVTAVAATGAVDSPRGGPNAFGLLRLIMACAVIVSHAFPIGGFGHDPTVGLVRNQTDIGGLAVLGFFAISGYLITRSGQRGGVRDFLWRRALRILPGFWVVLVVVAVVFGPVSYLLANGNLGGYVTGGPRGPVHYVVGNAAVLIVQYDIAGAFAGSPYGSLAGVDAVNGSLWSLFFECLCYLAVALAMALGLLGRRTRWLVAAVVAVTAVITQFQHYVGAFGRAVDLVTIGSGGPELYLAFGAGACAALFPEQIRWSRSAGAVAALVVLATLRFGGFASLGLLCFAYVVLCAAFTARGWACRVGTVNDISYGIYIYAWPVAMLLQQLGAAATGVVPFALATLAATVPLAAASWRWIERPAMRLKSRPPSTGARRRARHAE